MDNGSLGIADGRRRPQQIHLNTFEAFVRLLCPKAAAEGLTIVARLAGTVYPVLWVCQEKTNPDGSLPQRSNLRS